MGCPRAPPTMAECEEAASQLGKTWKGITSNNPGVPVGCYIWASRNVWFNTHATGNTLRSTAPVCNNQAQCKPWGTALVVLGGAKIDVLTFVFALCMLLLGLGLPLRLAAEYCQLRQLAAGCTDKVRAWHRTRQLHQARTKRSGVAASTVGRATDDIEETEIIIIHVKTIARGRGGCFEWVKDVEASLFDKVLDVMQRTSLGDPFYFPARDMQLCNDQGHLLNSKKSLLACDVRTDDTLYLFYMKIASDDDHDIPVNI